VLPVDFGTRKQIFASGSLLDLASKGLPSLGGPRHVTDLVGCLRVCDRHNRILQIDLRLLHREELLLV
jgi:hypothetical protein